MYQLNGKLRSRAKLHSKNVVRTINDIGHIHLNGNNDLI